MPLLLVSELGLVELLPRIKARSDDAVDFNCNSVPGLVFVVGLALFGGASFALLALLVTLALPLVSTSWSSHTLVSSPGTSITGSLFISLQPRLSLDSSPMSISSLALLML